MKRAEHACRAPASSLPRLRAFCVPRERVFAPSALAARCAARESPENLTTLSATPPPGGGPHCRSLKRNGKSGGGSRGDHSSYTPRGTFEGGGGLSVVVAGLFLRQAVSLASLGGSHRCNGATATVTAVGRALALCKCTEGTGRPVL